MLPRNATSGCGTLGGVVPRAIEKEVVIEAPLEVVWRVVTDPEQIRQWFADEAEAGGTRLRVVESGFDTIDWSDAEKAKYAEGHSRGWQVILGRLRDYAS